MRRTSWRFTWIISITFHSCRLKSHLPTEQLVNLQARAQDIEAVDPEYYKNLRWMLEHDIADVLELTFTEEVDFFGRKELVELKPGGAAIKARAVPRCCDRR